MKTEKEDIIDLTVAIYSPFDLACCPLCDNELEENYPALIFRAHGQWALAHVECLAKTRKEFNI